MQLIEFKTAFEVVVAVVGLGGLFRVGMVAADWGMFRVLPALGRPFQYLYWKHKRQDCEVCGRGTRPSAWFKGKPIRWICLPCRLTRKGVAA